MKLRRTHSSNAGKRALRVILLFGLVCLSGCRWQAKFVRSYHLHKAQNYFAKHKYAEAAIEFRNVVKLDPGYADGYLQLGEADHYVGNDVEAAAAFRRALDLNPKMYRAALQLGEIYLIVGDASHAQQMAQSVIAERPDDVQGMILLAKSYMGMKKYPEAIKEFEKAEQIDPSNGAVYLGAGIAQIAANDTAAAEASFKKAIEQDGTRIEAYRDLSNLYMSTGRNADAENILQKGVEKNPKNEQMLFVLADFYSRTGELAKAGTIVESIKKQEKSSAKILSDVGDFWHSHNQPLRALAEYQASYSAKPSVLVNKKLVNEYITLGNTAEAQQWNDRLRSQNPKDHEALVFQGAIDSLTQRTKEAIAILEPQATDDPSSIFVNYYLGVAFLEEGNLDKAQAQFNDCLKYDKNFAAAHLKLAQVLLRIHDPSEAADHAKMAIAMNPQSADGYLLDADAAMELQRWPEVEAALGVADRIAPGNYVVTERWAEYYALKGNFPRAEQEYKKALETSSKPFDVLSRMVAMYIRSGKALSGVEATKAYIAGHGADPRLFNLLAQSYAALNRPLDVIAAAQQALAVDSKNETALMLIGHSQERIGKYDDAESSYKRAIQLQPSNAEPYALLAALSMQRGNYPQAADLFQQALGIEPNSPWLQASMARALAEIGKDPRRALSLAQNAMRTQPMDPVISDQLAWVYHKSGSDNMAMPLLLECIKKEPENPLFQYDIAMVYLQSGNRKSGFYYLEKSLQNGLSGAYSDEARKLLLAKSH